MTNNMNIVPEKTAISNGTSNSCKMLANDFYLKKENIYILDYGCGRLRNTKYLIEQGFNVSIIDTDKQIKNQLSNIETLNIKNYYTCSNINFKKKYDVILLSFVLNVIPEINDRNIILENSHKLLKDNGVIYIEVRDDNFLKNLKTASKFNDGVLTGKGENKTFQKPYTMSELLHYLTDNKFIIISSQKKSNSIVVKIKKRKED